jgi:hypothetical protein
MGSPPDEENTLGAWGHLIARSRAVIPMVCQARHLADVSLSPYGTEENKGGGETPRISEPKSQITPFRPLLLGNGPARKSRTYRKAIYKRCNLGAPVFRPIPYGYFGRPGGVGLVHGGVQIPRAGQRWCKQRLGARRLYCPEPQLPERDGRHQLPVQLGCASRPRPRRLQVLIARPLRGATPRYLGETHAT